MKRILLSVVFVSAIIVINAISPKIGADPAHAVGGKENNNLGGRLADDLIPLADQFFAGDGSALTASKWGPNGGPFTGLFTSGNVANFSVVNGTGSGGGGISVAGLNATENFTYSAPTGTLATGGSVVPVNVSAGKNLDLGTLSISSAAGAGFIKGGDGAFSTAGGTYTGGFTLNSGTIVARGVNAMGGGGSNVLTINGGVMAANANRSFAGKYGGGINIAGNFQVGELSSNVPLSSDTATMLFDNNMALGSATRTITIGANGVYTFGGVIAGAAGSGVVVANGVGATGVLTFSGSNTYTGPTTISGGVLSVSAINNGGVAGNLGQATSAAGNLVFDGGTLRYTGTNASTNRNFTISSGKTATIEVTPTGDLTLAGSVPATTGGLTKTGGGLLNLSGTNLYTGDTVIHPTGALALLGAGSIATSQVIEIKGGAFFDVSVLTNSLVLSSGQAIRASGTTASGSIATVAAKGLTTAANSPLVFTAFNGSVAPLTIQGSGTVTVASGNPVTVNTTSALGVGDYTLISKGPTGTVAGTAPTSLTIGGSGLAAGTTGSIVLTGGQLVLRVTAVVSFSGPISVGTGETITSLTNPGGLFQQLNAGVISGNVTVNLTSDLTAETGTHALNQQVETGVGGYTIFFQASGGPRLIEGSNATALITLNGADRITFSGLAFGPNGITFRNTSTGATIRLLNDASNNSILSCIVEGTIFFSSGSTTGNDGNSVSDSVIRSRTANPTVSPYLFLSDGSPTVAVRNSNISIVNNSFLNFSTAAVSLLDADGFTVMGNSFTQTDARNAVSVIESDRSGGNNLVSQNSISGHSIDSQFRGISLGEVGTTMISRNRIFSIDASDPSFGTFAGIDFIGSTSIPSSVTLENNMISIVPTTLAVGQLAGIIDQSNAGDSITVNHNSILIGGSSAGTEVGYGFWRPASTPSSVSLLNNIFINARSGGESYAIADGSPNQGSWNSNNNLFVGTGSTPANFFYLGGTAVDLATWQAGPPARDANSIAGVANAGPFNVGNIFVSPNDLHLNIAGNNPALNTAAASGVTIDIDGQSRPLGAGPDIGADEASGATAGDAVISGRAVTADGRGIRNIRVIVTGGALDGPRIAITNAFGYFVVDGLRVGETYVVSVGGKRFLFDPPVRVVSLGEDALDIDFVGAPQ